MKANLPVLEARMLERWSEMALYEKIREERRGGTNFVLHDGPPYANGHIHLGHALNKILKDFVVKSKTMQGFDSPYVPGWDCHGLPIEIKVAAEKEGELDVVQLRSECRLYAQKFLEIQREEFRRLGIFGEWDNPYLTMDYHYEAETARLFGEFVKKGSIYQGLRPVHWCTSCQTALAEAEVEYADHKSPSVYVKFPVRSGIDQLHPDLKGREVWVLIWTTTPWTLPANLAVAFHPDLDYDLVEVGSEVYVVAQDLLSQVVSDCDLQVTGQVGTVKGSELVSIELGHPWLEQASRCVLGTHVTLDQGTGAVHTAPGHGHDDYLVGREYGLETYSPVDSSGHFIEDVEHFGGLQVFEANAVINKFMTERGVLLSEKEIEHSYPHCWRCHNPVIFRATRQWFINMDHAELRGRSLEAVRQVQWIPSWGQDRISNMIANRPDWCISRQRSWGVPIVVFYCTKCRQPLLSQEVVDRVADRFEKESSDIWFSASASELLPSGTACGCGGSEFEKESDILDVWFDSGVSHHVVLSGREDLKWPADVYLEGGDQYRGWFHSSLLVAVGLRDAAPYKTVVCHGWTLDRDGHAMSKSRGNVISPLDVMKSSGAEILRLWVASIDYTEDSRLDEEVFLRLSDAYRKIRNTHRFLLGNLGDFDSEKQVSDESLTELDRWALARMAYVAERVRSAYDRFEFHTVYHTLYNFCVVDLSSFYLDVVKDRLYVSARNSENRRAAQTAMFKIIETLVRLFAPLLPFTCEEIWLQLYASPETPESVHLAEFSDEISRYRNDELLKDWEALLQVRSWVSKALEESRQKKEIGNSLEAKVSIRANAETLERLSSSSEDLSQFFIVSEVELAEDQTLQEGPEITVTLAPGQKCERCWTFSPSVGTHEAIPNVCGRCYGILEEMDVLS